MGDIIHAMVALQFIKREFPTCLIDWIVEDSFKGILENNQDINKILPINLKSIKKNKREIFTQLKLINQYGENNYDVVIDAQGLLKSAIVSKIIGSRVVGSYILGFDIDSIREKLASFFYDKKVYIPYDKNVIERNLKVICEPLGIRVVKDDILNKKPFLFSNTKCLNDKKYIIFVVGASKPNKIYPKEKFLEVANILKKDILVVFGNESEYETALWLSQNSDFITLDTKGNLSDLIKKIEHSLLVIGGDTGPTHIAWGLNIPSITIFGNTPHTRNSYETTINKTIKSKSTVNPLRLDNDDFTIGEIEPKDIVDIARGLIK